MDRFTRLDGVDEPDWTTELASAVAEIVAKNPGEVEVERIRATRAEIEFVYRQPPDGKRRGLRISTADIPAVLRRTKAEIRGVASILAYAGILEPKSAVEFSVPDADGIRWMTSLEWFRDWSYFFADDSGETDEPRR